jgi:hypothetical protein
VNQIENVQRRYTKSVVSLFHLSYSELLSILKVKPLETIDCGRPGRQLVGRRRRMLCNATPASRPIGRRLKSTIKLVIRSKGFPDQAHLRTTLHTLFRSHSPCMRCAKAGVIHMHTTL